MAELVSRTSSWEYNARNTPDTGMMSSIADSSDEMGPILHPENDLQEKNDQTKEGEILQKILNIFSTSDEMPGHDGKNIVLMKMENTQPHVYKLIMEMKKEDIKDDPGWRETPFLVAARMGVVEMVEGILRKIPVAIHDVNGDGKDALLLAVENRKPKIFMSARKNFWEHVAREADNEGNTALHLAATLATSQPWLTPSVVLQMQYELKWYKIVSESMPSHLLTRRNNKGQTAKDVFTDAHKDMVKEGAAQLTSMSNSCSVVAALIATVAFATAATIPGGYRAENGIPTFQGKNAFDVFTISSLIALCFSIISIITFLAILNYPYQESDFGNYLPKKLIIGFTALLLSIAFMFVSFCASHFFLLEDKLHYAAYPVYATVCFSIILFAIFQFPLYFDLIKSTIASVPLDY